MMNNMKNMFRKSWSCSHHGKPESTDGADCAMLGWLWMNAATLGSSRGLCASAVAPRRRWAAPKPASADPDTRRDPLLWRHPVIETDAIISIAELRAERLWRRRLRVPWHRRALSGVSREAL